MKRIALKSGIACCLIFLFSSYTNAQFTLTLSEAKKVLSEKILDLDPVEGIYDVQNTVVVSQPRYGSETHKQHFTWAIVKVDRFWEPGENGKDAFFVISISGSVKGAMGVVEKLGAESYYTFWGADGKGRDKYYRFQLENNMAFEITEKNYMGNASSINSVMALKSYPTDKMYREAISTKAQKSMTSSGTGFFLSKEGYIVTNNHVIENAQNGNIKITGVNEDYH